jgi:hypothetical protein
MENGLRQGAPLVLVFFMIAMIGSAGATSTTGLFFNEALIIENADSGLRTIEVDSSNNIFASFGTNLYKLDSAGMVLHERVFDAEILATALSPDGNKLALTLRTTATNSDTIHIVSSSDLSTLTSSDETESNANILMWSDNGANVYSNSPTTGVQQLNRDTLQHEVSYTGNHTGPMACFDVSETSGIVLTADRNGLIQLWDNDGEVLYQSIQLQSTINSCSIGSGDDYFAIATPDNGIRKWTFSGSELKAIDLNAVLRYEIHDDSNLIFAHKSSPTQHILVYDILNENIVGELAMFHEFTDYELITDDLGEISNIYTNSKVDHIVSYGSEIQKIGLGNSGTDTDGDGIPDSLDSDDDGDGIEDNWDLNCVDVGISCELLPDENYIRSIDVVFNSTHINVEQSFTLNKQHSASIRDLSRFSLDTDIKLSQSETQLFADSICLNMDQETIGTSVASYISIQNASLLLEDFGCEVNEGMVLMPANDRTSHIRYSVKLSYQFDTPQELQGLNIQIENHRLPALGSMAELSEQHPVSVTVNGEGIASEKYVPWHIQEDNVEFTLKLVETEKQSIDPTSFLFSPVVLSVLILGSGALLVFAVFLFRKQSNSNSYEITLDDEDYDEEEEEYIEDSLFNEIEELEQSINEKVASKRVPVRKQSANHAEKLLRESSEEVVRKRKARQTTQEPIRTKRRKLSDSQSSTPTPRKRRTVKKTDGENESN